MTAPIPSRFFRAAALALLLAAAYLRASGLYRGLDANLVVHPDSPKQVMMLFHYLHGNEVAYYDSLFYDGYPYGLNRVDEWAIRLAWSAAAPARRWLFPETAWVPVPSRPELFYWARALRVLYGLAAMALVFAAARRFGAARWPALGAAALYGLAPIGATVTHAATGDVGVDLFLALALYAVARHADAGRTRWLAAMAVACGMAFSCKFQGLLGLWMGGLPLLLAWPAARRPAAELPRRAAALAGGFLFGVLATNPAFFVNPVKTWRDMRLNFGFIQNYGVSADFLAKPFSERVQWGLGHNLPSIVHAIGYGFAALGLLALLLSLRTLWRAFRAPAAGAALERRRAAAVAAVATVPWLALLLATALKPAVQPFHFSFLLPALAAAVGMAPACIRPRTGHAARAAFLLLFAAALADLAFRSSREDFFWRRPEAHRQGYRFSQTAFGTPGYGERRAVGRQMVKSFYAEPADIPVFRNRPSGLRHPAAHWWLGQGQLPVPCVPFPDREHWIFANGPVFPRNDRTLAIPAVGPAMTGRPGDDAGALLAASLGAPAPIRHTLVFPAKPDGIHLGLRTGFWPSRYEIALPGLPPLRGFMLPNRQVVLPLDGLRPVRSYPATPQNPEAHLVPMKAAAQLGPVWATILSTPRERATYLRYGPDGAANAAAWETPDWDDPMLAEQLASLLYVESQAPLRLAENPLPLPGGQVPLAAGAYVLSAQIRNRAAAETRVRFEWLDPAGEAHPAAPATFDLAPGDHDVAWRFAKPFAPHDAILHASAAAEGVVVESWSIRPDLDALKTWSPDPAPREDDAAAPQLSVRFPGIGAWRSLLVPDPIPANQPFPFAVRFDLDPSISHKEFHELFFFLHVLDGTGQQIATLNYPLSWASLAPDLLRWQSGKPLPPGEYSLECGIFNLRTRVRRRFDAPENIDYSARRRRFEGATLRVAPPD